MAANKQKIQEIKDLLDQIQKQYSKLGENNPFKGMDPSKIKDADKEIKKLQVGLDGVQSRIRKLDTTFDDLSKTLKSIVNEINPKALNSTKLLEKGMKGLVTQANKLALEEDDIGSLSKKQLTTIKERALASQKMAKDNAAALLQEMGIRTQDGKVQQKDGLKIGRMNKEDREKAVAALGILKDRGKLQQDLIDKIGDRIGLEDQFNKKLGFGTKLAGGLDKALQKAGLPALGISDAIGQTRKEFLAAEAAGGKTAKNFSVMGSLAKNLGGNLMKAFTSANLMQGAFTFLIKAMTAVDKASGEFAKNNGISYQEALKLRGEMSKIARSSKDVMVNSAELMKTQESLNKFFGSSVKFSGKLAADMTSIARRTNMSEESQGIFALEAMKTGKGAKDILKTQTLQVLEMNKQKGLTLSVKQVQDAIGKTSKALQLTFKGSTAELTKQVMSMKALGVNMQQAESIASSLLDFESSIQAELEAELLLGQNINLEKARQAALEGDMGKMTEELMKNKSILKAFEDGNVIQQEAAAKAMGMGREELAAMIMEQQKLEAVRASGFEDMNSLQAQYNKDRASGMSAEEAAANVKDEDLKKQLESVSAQEKMAATLERVQELFVGLAEPILAIVTPIADIMVPALEMINFLLTPVFEMFTGLSGILTGNVEELSTMQVILGGIAVTVGTFYTIFKSIKAVQAALNILKKREAIMDIASIARERVRKALGLAEASGSIIGGVFKSLGTIPVIGAALAAVAAAAGIAYLYSKAGDVMSPADGKTRISTKEGGLFELSPNDDLVAAPGAADMMDKKGERGKGSNNTSINNVALIAKIDQLIGVNRQITSINQQILAKSSVIEMDGNEVGQGINKSERAIQ